MSDNVNLKTIIADEYKRCAKDPIYFFKKYVYIQHPTLGKIKFNLYKFQEMALKELFDYDYNIILKSRQLGISTLAAAIALHLMIFNKDKNVLVIATKQEVAKNMVSKVRYAYDNLPSWLKEEYSENNKLNLKLKNGSQIKATSSSGDAGRSEAVSMLVVDEAAFIPEIEEIWGSAQQTLATGGKAIVLSCVVKDTFIFTDKGIKTIFDFIPNGGIKGDYNITEYNIFGKNYIRKGNLFHNNGKVKTKIIKTKFSELEGSNNHKVLAYKKVNKEYKWPVELSELQIGDYVAIRKNMNLFGNNDSLNAKYSASNKIKNPIKFSKIDENLAYLFGLYISEGNANCIYNKNRNIVGGNLNITCGDDISYIFDELNLNYYCEDNLHYRVSNKNLIEIFTSVGFHLSDKANNKKIPVKLLEMSKNNIMQLLRGIFDGDGCASKKIVSYSSTSKVLIYQIRMLLLNFGILSHIFIHKKEKMNEYSIINKSGFKYNYDSYVIEIYGKNALRFYNLIGFNLDRKQKLSNNLKMCKFDRSSSHDVIPNSLQLMKKLYDASGETTSSLNKKYKININGILNKTKKYTTNNISRENVIKMFNLFSHLLPEHIFNEWREYIDDDIVWVPITEISESEAETFDFSLPNDDSDMWCHSVLYNGIIGHQTPNGVANWYHKEWVKAKEGKNKFHTVQLHWSMHPDRDQVWRDEQDLILGPRMAAQECDADFLASGNTVIDADTLKFYKETFIKPPIEMRGPNKELWIWESPNYRKSYLLCADVARGDGSDYSTAHILDVETMTQVAEFKAQLSTKDFGNFLVGLASEYNDALLVIENSTIGWAAIQQIIDRNYSNLFYTEQALKYINETKPKQGNKIHAIEKKSVPGFTTSPTSRPLIINKLEEYFRTRDFMLYSDRTMNELYAFIWNGQKAEAMKGYNDDLVMALAIGLWVRDTAVQLNKLKLQGTKANLDAFTVLRPEASFYGGQYAPAHEQWNIPTGHPGEEDDISKWLL